jgi:transcriptional regulator with XRE-family HTH domain
LGENDTAVHLEGQAVAAEEDLNSTATAPEERLGAALRRAREERGVSLRALAKKLYRSHSNLVEYERGHRLAPRDVVEAYEVELGLASQTLAALHERAQLEIYGEDRSRRRTYVLKPTLHASHQLPPDVAEFTGRTTELSKLRVAVTGPETGRKTPVVISAIAGMGGVGKTALAVHLAHELAPEFPDAQLYVNLHGYEPRQRLAPTNVLDRFLRALGVPSEALPIDLARIHRPTGSRSTMACLRRG